MEDGCEVGCVDGCEVGEEDEEVVEEGGEDGAAAKRLACGADNYSDIQNYQVCMHNIPTV